MKMYISCQPFSITSLQPERLLQLNKFEFCLNKHGRKITPSELANEIGDAEILIAGTEKITEEVFKNAPRLKLISRVGIGLDSIDFDLCRKYGVRVAYTPDAPTMAVAELCVGLIIDLVRRVAFTDKDIKNGIWNRHMGTLLYGKTVGIFGLGRIGKSLTHLLSVFNVKFKVHDIEPDLAFGRLYNVDFVSKEELLASSDIVSINIPLTTQNRDFIAINDMKLMKNSAVLINTARGGIVNENDLFIALKDGVIAGAAVDVFEEEPYKGALTQLGNCLLTCHMGASTVETRTDMEVQAVEEAIRFKIGVPLKNEVLF